MAEISGSETGQAQQAAARKQAQGQQNQKDKTEDSIVEDKRGSQFSNRVSDSNTEQKIENLPVFGENIFNKQCQTLPQIALFNPEYVIRIGDKISVTLWGAFEYSKVLTVDSQGNIFIPKVGPVHVADMPNKKLNERVNKALKKTFEKNVEAYANLLSAQPIMVFVSGYVQKPGLYDGISSDSILYFLCRAGGIIPEQGSFRQVRLVRDGKTVSTVDLYDFLTQGRIPFEQLQQGDSIVVEPRNSTVKVMGDVRSPAAYEPSGDNFDLARLLELAGTLPKATYVLIEDNSGSNPTNTYVPLDKVGDKVVEGGEIVTLKSDQNVKEMTISITGSVYEPHQFVVPIGTKLSELVKKINFRPNAEIKNMQLFRESVAKRQKEAIQKSLHNLERQAYTNSALTKDGLQMQAQYADLVSRFVEKAKKVEPKGQVILGEREDWNKIALQNNDVLHVPNKTDIVMVSGQVMSPIAVTVSPGKDLDDYIHSAGGFTSNANTDSVLVMHENGNVERVELGFIFDADVNLQGGDQIVATSASMSETLPVVATISEIVFQIAIAARVVLNPF